ncbi:protealysin inhibitor emfourin [Angustibacter sp. McL0619]|uniref:protealysin inhibitor emfourin n=1 Tax=Angustibacter sp. McL0619 TaxID=3415676 RepID=UPI003CEDFDF2
MRATPPLARLAAALLGGALLVGASACGSEQPSGTAGSTPASLPATSGNQPGGLASPVVLIRTGGIAGMNDALVLMPDGTYTVTRKNQDPVTRRADAGQLRAIADAVQGANLSKLPPSTPDTTTSDQISYRLSVGSRTYQIAGTQTPDEVRPLLDELGALFSAPATTP